ncbi:ParM/StbA family protein [Leptolyngbya sp. AN03gr2]|uniref:ParM/StbA family protein n=1 Tax=unclassified Leptolyngbya TaxID=2650499 RepID=UPI003D31EEDD
MNAYETPLNPLNVIKHSESISTTVPIAFDVGNHEIKVAYSNVIWVSEAVYAPVFSWKEVEDLKFIDANSAYVEYIEGDRTDLIGKKWIAGSSALTLLPDRAERLVSRGGNRGKVDLGLQMLLAAISPRIDGEHMDIVLVASMPELNDLAQSLKPKLLGTHKVIRNGKHFTANIKQVAVMREGSGMFVYGRAKELFSSGAEIGTIDLGGGTTITQAFQSNGKTIPAGRLVLDRGVNDLIAAIVADKRWSSLMSRTPDASLILQGIRSGKFLYGGQKIAFEDIYTDHRRVWIQSTVMPAIKQLSAVQDRLEKVFIIGGGSQIIKSAFEQNPDITCLGDDAQTAHVQGMLLLARRGING